MSKKSNVKSNLHNRTAGKTKAVMDFIREIKNPYLNSGTDEGWKLEKAFEFKRNSALKQITANKMLEIMEVGTTEGVS